MRKFMIAVTLASWLGMVMALALVKATVVQNSNYQGQVFCQLQEALLSASHTANSITRTSGNLMPRDNVITPSSFFFQYSAVQSSRMCTDNT